MYKSKNEIDKKLRQVKFIYNEIRKFKNRVFEKDGLDETTRSYPLLTHLGSFLAHSRSVLQYAQKEAKESGKQFFYDDYVGQNTIFKFFKKIRDSEIHEYTINTHMEIIGESPIISYNPETRIGIGKEFTLHVESLEDLNSPKQINDDVKVTISLSKKIEVDETLIRIFETDGESKLAERARSGKDIFKIQRCEEECDIFRLCENYIDELEIFVEYGIENGFIT